MRSNRIVEATITAFVAIGLQCGPVSAADVIYDNNVAVDNLGLSDASIPQFLADDFILQPGANTITDIHWTGMYFPSDEPPPADDFTIQFYVDNTGTPLGDPFATFSVGATVNRTDTGDDVFGFDLFSYSVDISPLILAPNTTFWVSIFNNTPGISDDNWAWGLAASAGTIAIRFSMTSPWVTLPHELDFQLTGPSGVPEPGTLALIALALAALAFRRRKRAAV